MSPVSRAFWPRATPWARVGTVGHKGRTLHVGKPRPPARKTINRGNARKDAPAAAKQPRFSASGRVRPLWPSAFFTHCIKVAGPRNFASASTVVTFAVGDPAGDTGGHGRPQGPHPACGQQRRHAHIPQNIQPRKRTKGCPTARQPVFRRVAGRNPPPPPSLIQLQFFYMLSEPAAVWGVPASTKLRL